MLQQLVLDSRAPTEEERHLLARWPGWGATPELFDEDDFRYAQERAQLRDLWTDGEWAAARRTVLNAHYTSRDFAHGIWEALAEIGFTTGAEMVLLNERVRDGFVGATQSMMRDPAIEAIVAGTASSEGAFLGHPHLLMTDTDQLSSATLDEAFGPLIVVVRYGNLDDVLSALHVVPPSLTATIHGEPSEAEEMDLLATAFLPRAGRLIFNGYPTGVRVSWAQNHGGPWPATNTVHTSVGVASMRRFLRPMVWQNAPDSVLPELLRKPALGVPIRIDGVLTT